MLKRKHPAKKKQAPMQMVKSGVPMQRIATDILGEFPETENGNTYILVVSDYFRHCRAYHLPFSAQQTFMNNKFVPLAIQRLHYIIFLSNAVI
jgi:hypothetical protein